MAAYMINCLYAMQTTLSLYEYTDQRLEMLEAQVGVVMMLMMMMMMVIVMMIMIMVVVVVVWWWWWWW